MYYSYSIIISPLEGLLLLCHQLQNVIFIVSCLLGEDLGLPEDILKSTSDKFSRVGSHHKTQNIDPLIQIQQFSLPFVVENHLKFSNIAALTE